MKYGVVKIIDGMELWLLDLDSGEAPPPGFSWHRVGPTGRYSGLFGTTNASAWLGEYHEAVTIAEAIGGKVMLGPTARTVQTTGHTCRKCNIRNDYAVSNRPDGSYLCYDCR